MLFADTMAIFFVILGLLLAFPSLWLMCKGIWPEQVERTTELVGLKSFFVGIPVTVVAVFIVIGLGKLEGIGQAAGILGFSVLLLFAEVGVAGIATVIGRRLKSPVDQEQPWRATLRGGIVLVLSYLLPLVGWFLILPITIISGGGAATRMLFPRKKAKSLAQQSSSLNPELSSSTQHLSSASAAIGMPDKANLSSELLEERERISNLVLEENAEVFPGALK